MKQRVKQKTVWKKLLPVLAAMGMFLVLTILLAWALQGGLLPMTMLQPAAWAALLLSALLGGVCTGGGGKRGLLLGGILSGVYLICKLLVSFGDVFSLQTLIGVGLCVAGAWIGSCIFHKKSKPYTNRNKRKKIRK